MCMVNSSMLDNLFDSSNIVSSLYIIVFDSMCAITRVFGKGPMYGMRF